MDRSERLEVGFPPREFCEDLELAAFVSDGRATIEDVHVFVQYAKHRAEPIRGAIIGSIDEYERIKSFASSPLSLRSMQPELRRTSIECSDAYIACLTTRGEIEGAHREIPHKVADLNLHELIIRTKLSGHIAEEYHETFLLDGRHFGLCGFGTHNASFDGSLESKWTPTVVQDSSIGQIGIAFRPTAIWELPNYSPADGAVRKCTMVDSLVFTASDAGEAVATNQRPIFRAVADDLLLLASIVTRKKVFWYKCDTTSPVEHCSIIRSGGNRMNASQDGEFRTFVKRSEFFSECCTTLREARRRGINLELPISMLYEHDRRVYSIERFVFAFIALDHLCQQLLASSSGLRTRYAKDTWSAFAQHCFSWRGSDDEEFMRHVRARFGELNRYSQREVFGMAIQHCRIEPKKICAQWDAKPMGFIEMRNEIFHGRADSLDASELYHNTVLIEALVESMFYSILGWKGIASCGLHGSG